MKLFYILLLTSLLSAQDLIPSHAPNTIIIKHEGYTVEFSPKYEQALWSYEKLTKEHLINQISKRSNNFKADPFTPSANPSEYSHSGYDKGHLTPAADMQWSQQAMNDCFYMSNISPQTPSFNRGIWDKLERQTRRWAYDKDSLHIITGGILHDGLKTIGNHIAVPDSFYKIILDNKHHECIAFILKNENSKLPLNSFEVPASTIEKLTNIKFFPNLPNRNSILSKTPTWNFN